MITVKPAQGKMIRDPLTQRFVDPDKGLRVDGADIYWRRRVRDGDVVIVGAADDAKSAAAPAAATSKAPAKTAAKSTPATGESATQDSGAKQ
jgi:hypothetical protein